MEIDNDPKPTINVYAVDDAVCVTLDNASVIEDDNGILVPGVALAAKEAVKVAHALLELVVNMEDEE